MIKEEPNLSVEHRRATFADKLECVRHTDLKAKWVQHTKGHWLCYVCAGDKNHGPVYVTDTAAIPNTHAVAE